MTDRDGPWSQATVGGERRFMSNVFTGLYVVGVSKMQKATIWKRGGMEFLKSHTNQRSRSKNKKEHSMFSRPNGELVLMRGDIL